MQKLPEIGPENYVDAGLFSYQISAAEDVCHCKVSVYIDACLLTYFNFDKAYVLAKREIVEGRLKTEILISSLLEMHLLTCFELLMCSNFYLVNTVTR